MCNPQLTLSPPPPSAIPHDRNFKFSATSAPQAIQTSGEHPLLSLYKLSKIQRQGNTATMARRGLIVPDEEDGRGRWYFSRKEIEENSPSRSDGIDLKKETYFRKSYCSFLQDLGMKIKVPQLTIATATIFCHRFFLRQSHVKHDRLKIATACLFLASKVEESPRPLRTIILFSYEIIHRKDSETVQRIFKKEGVYEEQKELILQGEKFVLETLDFDLSVNHPYKPLVDAIEKFKGFAHQKALAQVAWNFVNDGLRTSLCLQLKPHQVAAGAFFLAAKFLKIKLPSGWWHEFAVNPRQLEDISNQILELYEQNSGPSSSHAKASGAEAKAPSKVLASGENASNGSRPVSSRPVVHQAHTHNHLPPPKASQSQNLQDTDSERHIISVSECKRDGEIHYNQQCKQGQLSPDGNALTVDFEPKDQQEQERVGGRTGTSEQKDATVRRPPPAAIKRIVENKVQPALEKRRKLGPDSSRKRVCLDEDELIEMQLENGIELL